MEVNENKLEEVNTDLDKKDDEEVKEETIEEVVEEKVDDVKVDLPVKHNLFEKNLAIKYLYLGFSIFLAIVCALSVFLPTFRGAIISLTPDSVDIETSIGFLKTPRYMNFYLLIPILMTSLVLLFSSIPLISKKKLTKKQEMKKFVVYPYLHAITLLILLIAFNVITPIRGDEFNIYQISNYYGADLFANCNLAGITINTLVATCFLLVEKDVIKLDFLEHHHEEK